LWFLISDRNQNRVDLAAAQVSTAIAELAQEQAAETARIHRAHLTCAADQARQFDAIRNDFQSMEGCDAPLSPWLRATADRLWG